MVSKTSVSNTKAAPKVAVKKKTTAKSPVKAEAKKVLNSQIPVKENVNPVEKVLEIKAHNEEIKAQKKAKRAPVKAKAVKVDNKALVSRPVEAKKVVSKPVVDSLEKKNVKHPVGMWAIWWDTIKKTFDYKGRTSRYEYWAFMLINLPMIFVLMLLVPSLFVALTGSENLGVVLVITFLVIELLVLSSLCVRRIHDAGYSAWNGYFRQLIITSLVWVVLLAVLNVMFPFATNMTVLNIAFGISALLFFILLFIWIFYFTKIGVVSAYYESEKRDNKYGELAFYEDYYKAKGLKYTVLFLTICYFFYVLIYILVEAVQHGNI